MSTWRLKDTIDILLGLVEGQVKPAIDAALGDQDPVVVSRYRPRQPNLPAIWFEHRPSQTAPADQETIRDEIYVALICATRHTDESLAAGEIELMFDEARQVLDVALNRRPDLDGIHQARRVAIEPPTPTDINEVPVFTSGLVIRFRLDAIRPQP